MEGHQGGEQHAVYGEQQGWAEQGAGHHYPAPYSYPDTFGWAPPPQPAPPCFSPRGGGGGLASPHTFPTMSVNVSMNMTMHGVGYDLVADQWQHGYDQVRRMFYQLSNFNSQIIFLSPPY